MKKVFIQFWNYSGDPAGASLHLTSEIFKKWKDKNPDLTVFGNLEEVEISSSLFYEVLYNDGSLELRQNSLTNLVGLGEIKGQCVVDVI